MSEFTNASAQHQDRSSSFETKIFFESTTSFVSNLFISSSVIFDLFQSVQNTDSKSEFVRIESRGLFQTKSFLLKKERSIIKTLRRIRRLNEKKNHFFFMIESKFNSAKNNENLWKKIKKNKRKLAENSKINRMIQKKAMLQKQILSHLKILRKFVTKSVFILKHNSSFLTEIQIAKTDETNKLVINAMHQMKMISVRTEKTSTTDFIDVLKLISITIAIEITNILQMNYNLISNFIEVSSTTLNSKNFNLISIFNLTSQSLRSLAEKMQYWKKIHWTVSETTISANSI